MLRRKLAALLARVAPVPVGDAKSVALAHLSGLSDEEARAVGEVVAGHLTDAGHARARLDAARVILAAIGAREQTPCIAAAQSSVTVTLAEDCGRGTAYPARTRRARPPLAR